MSGIQPLEPPENLIEFSEPDFSTVPKMKGIGYDEFFSSSWPNGVEIFVHPMLSAAFSAPSAILIEQKRGQKFLITPSSLTPDETLPTSNSKNIKLPKCLMNLIFDAFRSLIFLKFEACRVPAGVSDYSVMIYMLSTLCLMSLFEPRKHS